MKRLLAITLLALPLAASAQTVPTARTFKNAAGQAQDGIGVTIVGPMAASSATVGGFVATANIFQSVLAVNGNRLGCAIYNTSAAAELIFLGAPGSATTGTSIPLPAGGSFNCGSFQGLVLTDQVSITSATQGATFVAVSQ